MATNLITILQHAKTLSYEEHFIPELFKVEYNDLFYYIFAGTEILK